MSLIRSGERSGRSADGRIKENDAVLIDYSVRNSRLDAVIRQKDGSLIIRKGTPAPVFGAASSAALWRTDARQCLSAGRC